MQAGRDAEKDLAMCEATTPGPWIYRGWPGSVDVVTPSRRIVTSVYGMDEHEANARGKFIAESREALPYWINVAQTEIGKNEQLVEMWNRLRLIAEKNCWDNITGLMDDLEQETRS